MRLKSNNPVYSRIMNSDEYQSYAGEYTAATYGGVARKAMFFIALVFIGAFGGLWLMENNPALFINALIISLLTSFIFALLGMVVPRLTKIFGSLYCLGQGMLIGVVSLAFEAEAPGIVMTALLSVVVVLAVTVTLFITNVVKVNGRFLRFLMVFAISMIFSLLLIRIVDLIFGGAIFSTLLIPISALSTFLATLYLFFDLQRVYQIVEGGAPASLEWNVAFGLVYVLIWLFIEILRLLFILGVNRD
ncbi:MAG: Bax inhibitor-1/YccA family membrane protein [Bacilli bacterium]|jgi:uncharacterized YccA/Bax inhibitor family protein